MVEGTVPLDVSEARVVDMSDVVDQPADDASMEEDAIDIELVTVVETYDVVLGVIVDPVVVVVPDPVIEMLVPVDMVVVVDAATLDDVACVDTSTNCAHINSNIKVIAGISETIKVCYLS